MAERQWREAEAALRLAPDLPRAHQAVGLALYWGRGDYRAALEQMTLARDLAPNDGTMWAVIAGLDRRLGDWDSACAAYQRAIQLGPHAADARRELGWTYFAMRRYPEALDALDRATRISPSYSIPVWRGLIYAVWRGQLDSLDAALGRLPPDADLAELGGVTVQRARLLLWQRRPDSVVALLGRAPERAFEGQLFYLPRSLLVAWAQLLRGDSAAARAAFTSARTLLDSVARVLPQDWRIYAARGEALAGLGLRQEALGEVRWLEQSDAYRKDHFDAGTTAIEARASILARVGDAGAALAEIERLLSGPSEFSVHTFRLDPRWDPIRRDPRFQALLVRYANPGAP
jgi:tetratricopeptide (TPR) repeat protein